MVTTPRGNIPISIEFCQIDRNVDQSLIATAIHDGHAVREEVEQLLSLTDAERLHEEDPFTAMWAQIADNSIVVSRSRFEVDLNRIRESAVYIKPKDAWGLKVWKNEPPADLLRRSLAEYNQFYSEVERFLRGIEERHGRFVVFDLHSYNHLRDGLDQPPADPRFNPEINIGTGSMPRDRWSPVVDRFISDLKSFDYFGRSLDVRENVKFKGGYFSRWIHETFPDTGCSIAIEVKKTFMNEWTGELYPERHAAIGFALQSTISGVLEELATFG
ncbi:N-formylglutamate amidohydrolase [bacterium]|nr:N-formylglutamate amidohydrolase [bacterium]